MFVLKRLLLLSVAVATLAALFPGTSPTASSRVLIRGAYGRDSSTSGVDVMKSVGMNTVTYNGWAGRAGLDTLWAKGMKAVIWLGEYDRTSPCAFELSDAQVRADVTAIAGHPGIAAYQLSDEPNYARLHCPNAVQDHRNRSALIHSLDPSKPTYVTISTWDGREGYPYEWFAGVADIMGLDVYVCSNTWDSWGVGCQMNTIDTAVAQAAQKGVTRYWGILQDFSDNFYRSPTATELSQEFSHWENSNMEGYFIYHWSWGHVETLPGHLAAIAQANAQLGAVAATTTTPAPSLTPTSSPPTTTVISSPSSSPAPIPTSTIDRTPPTAPTKLSAWWQGTKGLISWAASTDAVGVWKYRVTRDGAVIATLSKYSLALTDFPTLDVPHTYTVVAIDKAGNVSLPGTVTRGPCPVRSPSPAPSPTST